MAPDGICTLAAGCDRLDAFAFDSDDHVLADGVAGGVEEMSGKKVGGLWGWRRDGRWGLSRNESMQEEGDQPVDGQLFHGGFLLGRDQGKSFAGELGFVKLGGTTGSS